MNAKNQNRRSGGERTGLGCGRSSSAGVHIFRRFFHSTFIGGALCFGLLVCHDVAEAQSHGLRVFNVTNGPICVGEPMDCHIIIEHTDPFEDSIEIMEAFDEVLVAPVPPRVPASGNLPIVEVIGNTTCRVGGDLPCVIGPPFSTQNGLPGEFLQGIVAFRQNEYTVKPGDPSPTPNLINVRWRDLCDSPVSTICSQNPNHYQFSGGTDISNCDDGDSCTLDSCSAGGCANTPIVCEEGSHCVEGECRECNSNGVCDIGEDCNTCPDDCPGGGEGCGNGICELALDENCVTCPVDCNGKLHGKPNGRFCCGTSSGRLPEGCADDRCVSGGFACSEGPVTSCCGDGECERLYENSCNCAQDCDPPSEVETDCGNGLDDDCNGMTDGADPNCACGDRGASCTSEASCCSGVCSRRGMCR